MTGVQASGLFFVLPILVQCCRVRDTTTGLMGVLSRMMGLGCLSLATKPWIALLSLGLYFMSEFAMPSVRSILSKIVGPDEKSQIFAFLSAQQSIAFLLSSTFMLIPGSMTVLFPGLGMAIAAGLQIVPFACLLYLRSALDENNLAVTLWDEEASETLSESSENLTESSDPSTS